MADGQLIGTCENRDLVRDVQVANQAISTTLAAGLLVYLDGSNGIKVMPTDNSIPANRARFPINIDQTNGQTSTAVLGSKKVETVKGGAIVIGKCDGTIVVGEFCQPSATSMKGGQFQAWQKPANASAMYSQAETDAVRDAEQRKVAVFLGKLDSGMQTGTEPANGADTNLGRFRML